MTLSGHLKVTVTATLQVIKINAFTLQDSAYTFSDVCYHGCQKGQKHVTLSSTKAEYVAVSEVCQEIMFIKSILEFIGVKIKTLITVYCDNVRTIFLEVGLNTLI